MSDDAKFQFEYIAVCQFDDGCDEPAVAKLWHQDDQSDLVLGDGRLAFKTGHEIL